MITEWEACSMINEFQAKQREKEPYGKVTYPEPPKDGTEFWAIIEAGSYHRCFEPVKCHWFTCPNEDLRAYWGSGLDGWSAKGFNMEFFMKNARIVEWWPIITGQQQWLTELMEW